MINIDEDRCEEFGLDPKKVASIAKRLSRAAREAEEMKLTIFGGSGSGSLRYHGEGRGVDTRSVVANLEGAFDGGDGGDVFN
jgi:hypothetical protein